MRKSNKVYFIIPAASLSFICSLLLANIFKEGVWSSPISWMRPYLCIALLALTIMISINLKRLDISKENKITTVILAVIMTALHITLIRCYDIRFISGHLAMFFAAISLLVAASVYPSSFKSENKGNAVYAVLSVFETLALVLIIITAEKFSADVLLDEKAVILTILSSVYPLVSHAVFIASKNVSKEFIQIKNTASIVLTALFIVIFTPSIIKSGVLFVIMSYPIILLHISEQIQGLLIQENQ